MAKQEETFDTKEMLKNNVGKKIKLSQRVELKIVKATEFYKEGQIITPHKVVAEELIKKGIAKEV